MFSKSCEYGIKAVIYIATQSLDGKRVKINAIAENSDSPIAFTAKIVGLLKRNKIVTSLTGPFGGFEIDINSMKRLKLSDVIYAIDGNDIFKKCTLGLHKCDGENPCPIHHKIIGAREKIKLSIEKTSLYELAAELKSGKTVLKR